MSLAMPFPGSEDVLLEFRLLSSGHEARDSTRPPERSTCRPGSRSLRVTEKPADVACRFPPVRLALFSKEGRRLRSTRVVVRTGL